MGDIFQLHENKEVIEIVRTGTFIIKVFVEALKDFFRDNDLGHRVYILKDV